MLRFTTILLLSLTIISNALSQADTTSESYVPEPQHPNWFKAIPFIDNTTPKWAVYMYENDDQYDEIISLMEEYYLSNAFEKNIHTQNFKHWRNIVECCISDKGIVELPDPVEQFKKQERIIQESKSQKSNSNQWCNIGPTSTYKNNGSEELRPTQTNIFCLGVAPSNTSVLYASAEAGGIFKTTDKALNWTRIGKQYPIGTASDIKVDPNDENIVYLTSGTSLYKTVDGGTVWTLAHTAAGSFEQLYINPTSTNTLFAATQNGLLKSTDSGSTWTTIYSGYIYDIETRPGSTDTMYISTKNTTAQRPEIYRSINGGDNWTLIDNGFYTPSDINNATVYGCKIGVTAADPDRIYAGIIANGKVGDNGWIGVYYSEDGGDTWQDDSGIDGGPYASGSNMNTNWYVAGYSSGYHQGWYNYDLDVSSTDADKFWIGTIWFCESANKGGNFEYIRGTRSLEMHADIQDIDVVGDEIWIASDGGINYSNDECQTVEVRMNGINSSHFWGFSQGWNENIWVGGRYHNGNAAYNETYGGGKTVFLGGAETATGYVNPLTNKKAYFSDITDKVVPDSLHKPSKDLSNIAKYPTQSYFHFNYSEMEWHPYYANRVYVGENNILYHSTNGGASFDPLYTFPNNIFRYEISRDDPDYIYVIVKDGSNDHNIYRSIDGGASFIKLPKPPYTSGSWKNLSISLNPMDKNEIWQASNSSSNGNKIFSSTDGGMTWQNRYGNIIQNQSIKDIIFQHSPGGNRVYAMTNDNFYTYQVDADEWAPYNTDLPVTHRGFKILPFYRDNKIRMASSKGIWEINMLNANTVDPLPMVSSDSLNCSRDTLFLDCHSIVDHTNTSWEWIISPTPSWIDNSNIRNPKVILGGNGDYDVTLNVTHNGVTYAKTITDMVNMDSNCEVDTLPINAFTAYGDSDYFVSSQADLTDITHFTVTGWWKPTPNQEGFAALFSSGDWCAHCDYTEGLIFDYWGNKLWYKWPGNASAWGTNSGITIPIDEWSYVALVIEPTGATLYLNDEKYVDSRALSPGEISQFYIGRGHYSNSFKGQIDEVTLWTRALDQDEIRLLRHITKENQIVSDPDLIAYYQFNELTNNGLIMDHGGTYHGTLLGNAELTESKVPVGGGSSYSHYVDGGGIYTFNNTGVSITFPPTGPYPDGDVVVSRINNEPDTSASTMNLASTYWVINSYGANETFNNIEAISLDEIGDNPSYENSHIVKLNMRSENNYGPNWSEIDNAHEGISSDGTVTFSTDLSLTEFGQFDFDFESNPVSFGHVWIGMVDTDWQNPGNWAGGNVPTTTSNVLIPTGVAYYPDVDLDVSINLLCIEQGASMHVQVGYNFEVIAN